MQTSKSLLWVLGTSLVTLSACGNDTNSEIPKLPSAGAANSAGTSALPSGGTSANAGSGTTRLIGGTSATGGGQSAWGGTMPAGGSPASGGASSGGTLASGGGSSTTGGTASSTGGAASNTGGAAPAAGGSVAFGGSSSTGGTVGAGGSTGGKASGGTSSTGGAAAGAAACEPAPDGISANALAAYNLVNQTRLGAGIPCAHMDLALNLGSQNHCDYYAGNQANATCIADPHAEVSTCAGFTGTSAGARATAAGYTGRASSECMAFSNNGARAVQMWIDSVWHRTPTLSPWVRDIGYGSATGCDTMDFGVGLATPTTFVATYPYAGQTGVPTSFDGTREGPVPPVPASGWPSGYPVHIYAQSATITLHELRVESTGATLEHLWITPADSNLLRNEVVLYGNAPLTAQTTYRVVIQGTQGTNPLDLSFTFTTR